MFGLTHLESQTIPLLRKLEHGSLPLVLLSENSWEELKSYTDTYLKEEIENEAATRNPGQFVRFLKVAAMQSGELLNYASVSNDSGTPETTVRGYFSTLHDTLLGHLLEPWKESKKRKAIQTAKFYFFDSGVQGAILDRKVLNRNSSEFGTALEHWIFHELRSHKSYTRSHLPICFWRSTQKHEVDFCYGDSLAIEVKATTRLTDKHFNGLRALAEENRFKHHVMVSFDTNTRTWEKKFPCFTVEQFIEKLWQGEWL